MLCARDLVKGEEGTGVAERGADEVTAGGRDVGVEGAKDGEQLGVVGVALGDARERVLCVRHVAAAFLARGRDGPERV